MKEEIDITNFLTGYYYEKDYYKILGIEKTDNLEIINAAFQTLSEQYEKDNVSFEIYDELVEAYAVLTDPMKKQLFDFFANIPKETANNFIEIAQEILFSNDKKAVKKLENIKDIDKYPILYTFLFETYLEHGYLGKAAKAVDHLILITNEEKGFHYSKIVIEAMNRQNYKYATIYCEKMINETINYRLEGLIYLSEIHIETNQIEKVNIIINQLNTDLELNNFHSEKELLTYISYLETRIAFDREDYNKMQINAGKFVKNFTNIKDIASAYDLLEHLVKLTLELEDKLTYYSLFEEAYLNLKAMDKDNILTNEIIEGIETFYFRKVLIDDFNEIIKNLVAMEFEVTMQRLSINNAYQKEKEMFPELSDNINDVFDELFQGVSYDIEIELDFINNYNEINDEVLILKEKHPKIYQLIEKTDACIRNKDDNGLFNYWFLKYPEISPKQLKFLIENIQYFSN